MNPAETLILVLGDQLSPALSSLRGADPSHTTILMAEVLAEATYVKHHKKKIALVFSAMRHFAEELRKAGWKVAYTRLDDAENTQSLSGEVARALRLTRARRVIVTEPGEWRLDHEIRGWSIKLGVPVEIRTDERFFASRAKFAEWASGRKVLRMEYFYRAMRAAAGILMDGDMPAGRRWNFDAENRKRLPRDAVPPAVARSEPDKITREVLDLVEKRFADHPGSLTPFWFAVTRCDAEAAFAAFLADGLPMFGDFQDAMSSQHRFLYHAVISPYLNCGLLDPRAVCEAAEAEYRAGRAPLNAVEGFIRQILGWREYVRGVYWSNMPGYAEQNALDAGRALPDFYWTGKTEMACLRAAIGQTLEEAYAHHIQRLMITGTFALLAGVRPQELHEWYLAVYADAYEWVELPNTLGMSQFADGGLLASKPYAASGAYIDRMSDYCGACAYDVREKSGSKACPFNYLYWDFLARNRQTLGRNGRLQPVYRAYERLDTTRRSAMAHSAKTFLERLDKERD